jgi:membrane-associated phospholipid phosphatase
MHNPVVVLAAALTIFTLLFLALWQAEINSRHRYRQMRRRAQRNIQRMGGGR